MSREVFRVHKDFIWPLEKTWWGFLLPSVPCQSCSEIAEPDCIICEGEAVVHPVVDPPRVEPWGPDDYKETSHYFSNFGWQMWESCSEGSPISPVMDTPEDLARWLADSTATTFTDAKATYEEWLQIIIKGGCTGFTFAAPVEDTQ